jgi:hypothetical protein
MEISVTIVDEISRSARERQLATLLAMRIARPVARARMNGSRIPAAHLIDHLRLAHKRPGVARYCLKLAVEALSPQLGDGA